MSKNAHNNIPIPQGAMRINGNQEYDYGYLRQCINQAEKDEYERIQREFYEKFAEQFYSNPHKYGSIQEGLKEKHLEKLGLPLGVTADQVKKQFKLLVHEYHPDKHMDKPEETREEFKRRLIEIRASYEYLLTHYFSPLPPSS